MEDRNKSRLENKRTKKVVSSQIVLIRSGDTIVTINDWTITLMDKPEVALHLFQAKP